MTFRWRADDGPTMNAGLVVVCFFSWDPDQYCYETQYFCVLSGGGGVRITCPPLWIRTCVCVSYRPPGKSQRYMNNNKIANLNVPYGILVKIPWKIKKLLVSLGILVETPIPRKSQTCVLGSPDIDPLENHKAIGFLMNPGADPLKITKL